MQTLISPQQLGFMPNRFFGEHGLTLQTTKLLATTNNSSAIALLLDQEKAYDRIHPEYLKAVMLKFGIPLTLVQSILTLVFTTQIQININGHITTADHPQHRGLRQGDPLSPLFFNIAFDAFLRSVQQNPAFTGFHVQQEASHHTSATADMEDLTDSFATFFSITTNPADTTPPPPPSTSTTLQYKILAYADDTLVYLRDTADFLLLQESINTYMKASNVLLKLQQDYSHLTLWSLTTVVVRVSSLPQRPRNA